MFSLIKPTPERVHEFLVCQRTGRFSYAHVGESRGTPPAGYVQDHNRVCLGAGRSTFDRAVAALGNWEMFPPRWTETHASTATIEVGTEVAVLARRYGVWALNACRVVYCIDEDGPITRVGFAYGTLCDHVESGEERFSVEWHRADDSVWYDLFAFSQPNGLLPRLVYPATAKRAKAIRPGLEGSHVARGRMHSQVKSARFPFLESAIESLNSHRRGPVAAICPRIVRRSRFSLLVRRPFVAIWRLLRDRRLL